MRISALALLVALPTASAGAPAIEVLSNRRRSDQGPPEVWSQSEQIVGHGFGGSFIDNVGIQYGLEALQQLEITPAQFVDSNLSDR